MRVTKDLCISTLLMVFCIVGFAATGYIRQPSYASISARLWPRITLALLLGIVLLYFLQSVVQSRKPSGIRVEELGALMVWRRHGNALLTFALFFVFLLLLPVLGMLLDGIAFVFVLQAALGETGVRATVRHALIAIVTVGAMWALFTYWLGVIMPTGMIINLD